MNECAGNVVGHQSQPTLDNAVTEQGLNVLSGGQQVGKMRQGSGS